MFLDFFEQTDFKLPDTFPCDIEVFSDLTESLGVFGQETVIENIYFLFVELRENGFELFPQDVEISEDAILSSTPGPRAGRKSIRVAESESSPTGTFRETSPEDMR